jgi:RimJ/RimL family protein N-acetyltransferase
VSESGGPTDGVVVLNRFRAPDAAAMRDGDRDPEHRRRFDFPPDFVPSIGHSLAVVARWRREREAGRRFTFAVRDVRAGTLLGGCELRPAANGAANLSYWTYPAHRKCGVASRAVALAISHAFGDLGLVRLELAVDAGNLPSLKVALRAGFRQAGFRDEKVLYVLEARRRRRRKRG